MAKTQNKYPGFIDGLKANNISTNKMSLDVYCKQIGDAFSQFNIDPRFSDLTKKNLLLGEETIEAAENESDPESLISLYIKFGNVLKTITPTLKNAFPDELKDVAINYINIATFVKDTRVNNLAIDIAKEAEA